MVFFFFTSTITTLSSQKRAMSDHAETVIDGVSRKAIQLGKKKEEIKAESIYFKSDLIEKEQWS